MFYLHNDIALFSFTVQFAGGVKGTIDPAANAGDVWAIIGNDSTKVTPLQGVFQISDLKAGTYKIVIEGKAPYKNYVKEGVVVKDGESLDLFGNGPGMRAEELEQIFQPFYRGGTVTALPGFGLGLPLVKRIINLHKGRILVESDLKTGSTFLVILPAAFRKTEPEQLQVTQL